MKKRKINVFNIVQYLLNKENYMDITKLQKLLYYAQGYYLSKYSDNYSLNPLFEEKIEAWIYGPVIPEVYAKSISQKINNPNAALNFSKFATKSELTEEQKKILDEVYERYKNQKSSELSKQTHLEEPWKKSYKPNKTWSECIIELKDLYDCF